MKAVKEKTHLDDGTDLGRGERYYIFCPACYEVYRQKYPDDGRFAINGALHCFSAAIHTFNGDLESPTISPSLLCSHTNNTTGERFVCHSYVVNGRIQYLGDCTHALAGQTVDLMDVPEQYVLGVG